MPRQKKEVEEEVKSPKLDLETKGVLYKLNARVSILELAYKEVKDSKDWMDDHYTKWQDIQEYKDEVNKLKVHFDTWQQQILYLQELTVIHEDPKSLINRLEKLEKDITPIWDERNRIVSRLDVSETRTRLIDEACSGLPLRVEKLENETFIGKGRWIEQLEDRIRLVEEALAGLPLRVEKLEGRLLNPMNWDITHIERLEKLEKRIKDFDGSNRSKPSWSTINQMETRIRQVEHHVEDNQSDIKAINEEFLRLYRKIPDDDEPPHQPTPPPPPPPTLPDPQKLFTDEDAKNYQHLYMKPEFLTDFKCWQTMVDRDLTKLSDRFVGLEKRMQETLQVAGPAKCDTCQNIYSEHTMKIEDGKYLCLKCRIDDLETIYWSNTGRNPKWEYKDREDSETFTPNPNDPLPGEDKYDYGTRMGKIALRRWDELYGQKRE